MSLTAGVEVTGASDIPETLLQKRTEQCYYCVATMQNRSQKLTAANLSEFGALVTVERCAVTSKRSS